MRKYRLLAIGAAGLVVFAGIWSVLSGSGAALPPPVSVRGPATDSGAVVTDELGFVPAPVIDLSPTTSSSSPRQVSPVEPSTAVSAASAASPDTVASAASADSTDSPDSADSPDG